MSSLVIKVGSLVIKTLSKPIANKIKAQAREHERFRRVCVNTAQGIHTWDMRFRLGLLQDTAAIEKQIAKDAAEAKKHKNDAPTVKTEAQAKADDAKAKEAKDKEKESGEKASARKPKIRPLSEAKAIDLGANFVSESFLFVVGVGLIIFEQWRRGRQEKRGREDVADRLNELEERDKAKDKYYGEALSVLEKEVIRLRGKGGILPGRNPNLLPEKPIALQEKDVDDGDKPGNAWFSWLKSKTIGSDERQEAREMARTEPEVRIPEVNTATPQDQPSPSIVEMVRQRTHARDSRSRPVDKPAGTSETRPYVDSKSSQ